MRMTAEISLYPLRESFTAAILECIASLRAAPGVEVVTNQMSTQVVGEFDAVMAALSHAMRGAMAESGSVVCVIKCLNADLPIHTPPALGRNG